MPVILVDTKHTAITFAKPREEAFRGKGGAEFFLFIVCLFIYLFGVFRPIRESHMETSPLPVKGCKF